MNGFDLTLGRVDAAPATGNVPAIVGAALDRNHADERRATALPHRSDAEHAARAVRLAVVADRRSRWWRVLATWAWSEVGAVPLVFADAVDRAADLERDRARFWREAAADWTARAEHRPTSDAAGALSNHHELGIAS